MDGNYLKMSRRDSFSLFKRKESSGSPEFLASPEGRRDFYRSLADTVICDSAGVTDAATLVFAHTLLDIHTSECLEILIEFDPTNWFDEVKNEKVKVESLLSAGVDEVLRDAVRKYKSCILKESITERIEALHRHCKPKGKHTINSQPYTYDAQRIKAFDQRRHGIIHKADMRTGFDLDSELQYVESTCIYLGLLVGDRLSAKWDLNKALDKYFTRKT